MSQHFVKKLGKSSENTLYVYIITFELGLEAIENLIA